MSADCCVGSLNPDPFYLVMLIASFAPVIEPRRFCIRVSGCALRDLDTPARGRPRGWVERAHAASGKIHIGACLTEFSFPNVSIASAGECFQVSFDERHDIEGGYFLIQRHFESCDDSPLYLECQDDGLCGHFRIVSAELERDVFRVQVACDPRGWFISDSAPAVVDMTSSAVLSKS